MKNGKTLVCRTAKAKTAAAALAVIAAVALPQIFHLLGMATHAGSALGEIFLPMHIAIFLVGYLAGPIAGAFAGVLSPVLSFALTSAAGEAMPAALMLPYMTVELGVYGLVTGLFARSKAKIPTLVSLLIAQISGRAVRALAILIGYSAFGAPSLGIIWSSVVTGLPGLALQWALIPLLLFFIEAKAKHE